MILLAARLSKQETAVKPENFEGVFVKKWVILGVCVCTLVFAPMPQFTT